MTSVLAANADLVILLARILLMSLFLITGWEKLTNFAGTAQYMASVGAPAPALSTVVAIVMEFGVGIALVLGVFTRPLALLLCLFTLATALIGHRYWTQQGAERHANLLNFYKNISMMGGLLLLAVTGPGRYALLNP
ncbi:DoxX family protein [Ottowia pentelensis]|uniref:DoxX family protein n=1 Tax=Ottowia pentelensis TaxID=511108 RepID=A0ABV6PR88_9BURK|nr:DoxX family protein [Ottowia sp.]MBS0404607.1 DoxX family protein [Pseudomonadota bacterium]